MTNEATAESEFRPPDLGLDGKSIIVVGAGRGIGAACCMALASAGARVACVDRDEPRARAVARDIVELGGEAVPLVADVLVPAEVRRAVDEAADVLGGLDVSVDVVGESRWSPLAEVTDEEWQQGFDLVLRHVHTVARSALRHMIPARSGVILNIGSISGLAGAPRHGVYGAAKAGILSLTRTLAVENARYGIRVNTVAPGAIRTPRTALLDSGERRDLTEAAMPMGRRGEPHEVAAAVMYLASSLATYVTGQTLIVDGGATATFALPVVL